MASSTTDDVSGVKWGGVSMTQIGTSKHNTNAARYLSLWYILNPLSDQGLTFTGGTAIDPRLMTASGVDPKNPFTNADLTGTGVNTNPSLQITTTAVGSYIVGTSFHSGSAPTPNAGTSTILADYIGFWRSTNTVDRATSSLSLTQSENNEWNFFAWSLNPSTTTLLNFFY